MPNHNEPLNQEQTVTPTMDLLDQRLIRALETAPSITIPSEFADRIAARLPAHPPASIPVSIPATHYGRTAMLIGIVLILSAMLALAAHTANHSTFQLAIEWILSAQFVVLTIWFSAWRKGVN